MNPRRIEDYAFISDMQSGALVAKDGSIDWACFPRFDSDACMAALLGSEEHGRWLIAPLGEYRFVNRRYRHDTLILETNLQTDGGVLQLIDFMPVRGVAPDIVRIVRCTQGRVSVKMDLRMRFDFGRIIPWEDAFEGDLRCLAGPDCLYLRSSLFKRRMPPANQAEWEMAEGEEESFVLTWHQSHLPRPRVLDARRTLSDTEQWWTGWMSKCRYGGIHDEAARQSMAVLKGLTHLPSGGIVAAATTSLPEAMGGERNWDYRHSWVRDSTFTLLAFLSAGYEEEARAWRDWLVRAIGGEASQLQVLYGVEGERRLLEQELTWLPGFANSRPVRAGNGAVGQFQLDIYGEVLDTLYQAHRHGMKPIPAMWNLQCGLIEFVGANWQRPDRGIWEVRGAPRLFTHSRVMAWVAIDRAIRAVEDHGMPGPVGKWRTFRDELRSEILVRGFNEARNSFVQTFDGDALDASLLLLPIVGFLPANDPRMRGTVDAIEQELSDGGLVRRYLNNEKVEGLRGEEGVFLACSFWLADNYALQMRHKKARELFELLLSLRNDVGLLSEEYDPQHGRMLGNVPQAFSHVALVNTVHLLAQPSGPVPHR